MSFTALSLRQQQQLTSSAVEPGLKRRKALMVAVGSLGAAGIRQYREALQPSFFALGVSGFLQPIMEFKKAYCEWEPQQASPTEDVPEEFPF